MHINPGSLKSHLSEISSLIDGVDLHVLAVSETWFNDRINDNLVKIPGFQLFRHDRKRKRGGGVLFIYVKYLYYLLSSYEKGKELFMLCQI